MGRVDGLDLEEAGDPRVDVEMGEAGRRLGRSEHQQPPGQDRARCWRIVLGSPGRAVGV